MWIVRRADIGRLAFNRLLRDGVVTPLLPGIALPRDVPDAPALRRQVLTDSVPAGCQVSGSAALWAHGVGPKPLVIDIRCAPGRHIRTWHAPLPVTFHGVGLDVTSGVIVDEVTAAADARRWTLDMAQRERRLAPVIRRAS